MPTERVIALRVSLASIQFQVNSDTHRAAGEGGCFYGHITFTDE